MGCMHAMDGLQFLEFLSVAVAGGASLNTVCSSWWQLLLAPGTWRLLLPFRLGYVAERRGGSSFLHGTGLFGLSFLNGLFEKIFSGLHKELLKGFLRAFEEWLQVGWLHVWNS